MSTMLNTKKVIDSCENYYDIIEERFAKDDIISKEIKSHYMFVIENTNPDDINEVNKARLFDQSVYSYFNDIKFNQIIVTELQNIDRETALIDFMINKFQIYKNDPANKVTTTKWI